MAAVAAVVAVGAASAGAASEAVRFWRAARPVPRGTRSVRGLRPSSNCDIRVRVRVRARARVRVRVRVRVRINRPPIHYPSPNPNRNPNPNPNPTPNLRDRAGGQIARIPTHTFLEQARLLRVGAGVRVGVRVRFGLGQCGLAGGGRDGAEEGGAHRRPQHAS